MTTKELTIVFVVTGLAILLVGIRLDNDFAIGYGIAKIVSSLYLLVWGINGKNSANM